MLLTAVDVGYDDEKDAAIAAAVGFQNWTDAQPAAEHSTLIRGLQPYVPGQFFKRELPCLLSVLAKKPFAHSLIIVDGYVDLGDKPGLGRHLYNALDGDFPVIGVAKSPFYKAWAIEVVRGGAAPLYVTAAGIDAPEAAGNLERMHGPFRIPTLLKRADQLSRATSYNSTLFSS